MRFLATIGRVGFPSGDGGQGVMSMALENEAERASAAVDPARDFLDFWRNYFEQTAIQTRVVLESMQGGKALEQLHHQWLDSLSQSLDAFMRTPAFIEVLKQTLKRMVEMKALQDRMTLSISQYAGQPETPDIAGVLERLRDTEQSILSRLAAIESRLEAIESKVNLRQAAPRSADRSKTRKSSTRGKKEVS
jgi:hypothetical protein